MRSHRTSFGGIGVGIVVTAAIAFVLTMLGVALYEPLGLGELTRESRTGSLALLGAIGLAISLFVGARFAAADGRAIVPRDGGLHGFVLWAALSSIGGLWGIGAYTFDYLDLSLIDLGTLAWGVLGIELIALLAALFGGLRGARAEARAIGLVDVRPSEGYDDEELDPERRFYADDPAR